MVAEVKNELQVKIFQSFLKNCMILSVPWYNIIKNQTTGSFKSFYPKILFDYKMYQCEKIGSSG